MVIALIAQICKDCGYPHSEHRRTEYGYILVRTESGIEYEHVIVAQTKIGRKLNPNESVHHLNHMRADNRPLNLEVVTTEDHEYYHKHKKKLLP